MLIARIEFSEYLVLLTVLFCSSSRLITDLGEVPGWDELSALARVAALTLE